MHACMSLRCTSTCTCKCKKWRKRMYPRAMTLLVIMIIKFLKFHMYMYVLIKEPYTLVHVWNKKIRTLISWHHACMQQTKLINIRACVHTCIKTKLINIRACVHTFTHLHKLVQTLWSEWVSSKQRRNVTLWHIKDFSTDEAVQ